MDAMYRSESRLVFTSLIRLLGDFDLPRRRCKRRLPRRWGSGQGKECRPSARDHQGRRCAVDFGDAAHTFNASAVVEFCRFRKVSKLVYAASSTKFAIEGDGRCSTRIAIGIESMAVGLVFNAETSVAWRLVGYIFPAAESDRMAGATSVEQFGIPNRSSVAFHSR